MQKRILKFLSINLAMTLTAAGLSYAQDDADFNKEARFHHIYKKYNENPTPEDAWEKVLAGRQANTYSVQDKDTLWDISHTLFGESHYWPKVWSYNTDNIENPHQINPSQVIKFYPGTIHEAPTVGVAPKSAPKEDLPEQILEKNEAGDLQAIKIPPPRRKSRPLVKKLPKSLPLYRLGAVNKPPLDFEVSGARVTYKPAPKYLSFYIQDNQIEGQGEVVEMQEPEEKVSNEHELIIVRVSNPGNKRLLVVKNDRKISDPDEVYGNRGYIVEVQGEIELRERVNEGDNLFRAVVTKAIQPIETGAVLIPGTVQTFNSGETPIVSTVQSKIVGGEFERYDQRMFGTDNIVFLSAGAKEGLQEGSTLNIFLNERIHKTSTHAQVNDRVIGQVKIIKLADHFATGYIVNSTNEILIGDYAGGAVKPAASSSAAASNDDAAALEAAPADSGNGGGGGNPDPDLDLDAPANGGGSEAAPPPAGGDDLSLD